MVIDCSGSIRDTNTYGVDNWQIIIDFVVNLVSSINVDEQETHVGAVSFGKKYKNCRDLLQLIYTRNVMLCDVSKFVLCFTRYES